jgi:putative Holliday junction resolvase
MNYLGVDFGRKRIGLSFAEGELGIAVPVPAVVNQQLDLAFEQIQKVITERKVGEIVIGYPLHMDGKQGKRTEEVDQFISGLAKRTSLVIHKVDERLSTSKVESDFKSIGKKVSKKSGEIDSSAATLILQDFMEQQQLTAGFPELDFEDE